MSESALLYGSATLYSCLFICAIRMDFSQEGGKGERYLALQKGMLVFCNYERRMERCIFLFYGMVQTFTSFGVLFPAKADAVSDLLSQQMSRQMI